MVEKIETLLLLLGLLGVLAVVAERARFPFPILLVIAGLGIAFWPGLPEVHLIPDLVFLIFLPPLLFSAAWKFPWDDFRSNLLPIFALAVGLVLATMLGVALTATWLIPGMTLATGFVLGAIVSPPDAVAATAVLKNLRLPKRLGTVLEGESLVNDSSGLVAYHFAVAAVVTGSFSMAKAGGEFLWMSFGGILLGLLVGAVVGALHRYIKDPAVEITLTLLTPYIAYLPAERLGVSGVLAVVTAGLYVGHRSWQALNVGSRMERDAIWKFLDYLLNGVVFILIGLQFPTILLEIQNETSLWQMIGIGALISAVVIGVRFLWVFPMAWMERRLFSGAKSTAQFLDAGALVVVSWAGMRGVVSLAAALALPLMLSNGEEFPYRHVILFLTFCVIFVTLVLQGLTLPFIVRWLGVEERGDDFQAESKARELLINEIIERIDEEALSTIEPVQRESLEQWRNYYEERLRLMIRRDSVPEETNRESSVNEKKLFLRLTENSRRRLAELRRNGVISEKVRQKIEYDFDLEEQRVQRILSRYG
jgi:monovalent cation/hydrogen antiporter